MVKQEICTASVPRVFILERVPGPREFYSVSAEKWKFEMPETDNSRSQDIVAMVTVYMAGAIISLLVVLIAQLLVFGASVPAALAGIVAEACALALGAAMLLVGPLALKDRMAPCAIGETFSRSAIAAVILGPVACIFFSVAVFTVVRALFGAEAAPARQTIPEGFGIDWQITVATFILIVFLTPLIEELIWRGWLYQRLQQTGNVQLFYTYSLTAFALAHSNQSITKAFAVLALGLLCCWLYVRTKGLLAPFLAHAINNGIAMSSVLLFK